MKEDKTLDKIDIKLLRELSIKSNLSIQHYARKIRVSRSVALYRMKRLEKEKIIQKYQTLIDFSKIGKSYARIGLKLINSMPEYNNKMVSILEKYAGIAWLGSTEGRYNLTITFLYHELKELLALTEHIRNNSGTNIERLDISILKRLYICGNNILNNETLTHECIDYSEGITDIDNVDTKILSKLSENSRINILDISSDLGISTKTVLTRKKNLEKNKTIMNYTIALNPSAFNKESYHIFWTFAIQDKKEIQKFKNYLLGIKETTFITEAIGMADLECDILASNIRDIYYNLNMIKAKFSSLIKDFDVMLLTNVHENF